MAKNKTEFQNEAQSRAKMIFKTSVIGIIVNVVLVAFKAAIGLLTNSIAIILDAINNLSDALSSVITIVGMKLAGRPADRKHPLGHGRVEYISSAVISVIVIYAGVSSLVSSVKQIIHPEKADYSTVSLIIIGVAVLVKLFLGLYVKKEGKKANSDALIASGADALFDSIISASTLVAAAVYLIWGISLEAYLGVIISVIIIKSGADILKEPISKILGERADPELALAIKDTVRSVEGVRGAYDLIINNYGVDNHIASIHIEVPDYLTADMIYKITREIQRKVLEKHGVFIAAVSIYSYNTKSEKAAEIQEKVEKIIFSHKDILQVHGFYLDETENTICVDFVAGFDAEEDVLSKIRAEVAEAYPEYNQDIVLDLDISE